MNPQQFIAKWSRSQLTERSACHEHFLDLCRLLGQPTPAESDPDGAWYTFERGARKTDGGHGWADVWMKGRFGWEYKGKRKDLKAAYDQLLLYREDLENPPLLVVCDMDRFEVHTNFTGTQKRVYAFDLQGLADAGNFDVLRKVFTDPEALRPGQTTAQITELAAQHFGMIADSLYVRGVPAHDAAHFLMKLMFCLFAEDIGLLPTQLFSKLVRSSSQDPARLAARMRSLFDAMAGGGDFGVDSIPWFNGGLFRADEPVVELRAGDIAQLIRACDPDWSYVEPSIFGTLFERLLDPAKRTQIGAHYTSREDIETLLKPVMLVPLRREWDAVREKCAKLWPKIQAAAKQDAHRKTRKDSKPRREFDKLLQDFIERLSHVTVLDPACGSGNFLYVALHLLLDLEKEVIAYAATYGLPLLPQVRATQLSGIEINPYAHELAQVVIWIGYLQWMHHNGFNPPRDPILDPIETIQQKDAILDRTAPGLPVKATWPEAEFIVGNPPFLGGKLLRAHLGDDYVDDLFRVWGEEVRPEADLCCYWFEQARQQIENGHCHRAGLLATQGIRGGANRETLKRIKATGDVFFAESDREWILDGAHVHVSMVGFDDGTEMQRYLDGHPVPSIHSNLTAAADITQAKRLRENLAMSFMGDTKGGPFDIPEHLALEFLNAPNPHGRCNSDVIFPWINGLDVARRPRDMWIIDFGMDTPLSVASLFEAPFRYCEKLVHSVREKSRTTVSAWWLHERPRPDMHEKLDKAEAFLATPRVSKHRMFAWYSRPTLPDCALIVFCPVTQYTMGLLHSRAHEVWARSQGTQVRERESGFRYTPTSCFETFPFPPSRPQRDEIEAAAREFDKLRSAWLNPPEWTRTHELTFPGSMDGPWAKYVHDADAKGIGTVRYPKLVAKDESCAAKLQRRTLTNLYNESPTWLQLAHQKLDQAVLAAYGWPSDISDDTLLANLLRLNLSRAG